MTASLLRAAQAGDSQAAELVLTENNGLIWSVARRYFGRGVDPDDLYQLGCVGFIKAVKGYDEAYGTRFSTYAVPKIAGEIRRFLRDDGLIKVSRTIKERSFTIKQARDRLVQRLGREPVLSELSEECGISAEEIAEAEIALGPAESFQQENGDGGPTLEGLLGVDGMEEQLLESISVREAVDALPEKESEVIRLRYFRGFTQEKTARILRVSQVQVSRIERRAMELLKKILRE